MNKSSFLYYVRILFALPCLSGFVFVFFAFAPITDDFSNVLFQSVWSRIGIFFLGLALLFISVLLAVPGLLKSFRISKLKDD